MTDKLKLQQYGFIIFKIPAKKFVLSLCKILIRKLNDCPASRWPFSGTISACGPGIFGGLMIIIFGAASSAIAVQYGMKLLVDAMSGGGRAHTTVWFALELLISLIVIENILLRLRRLARLPYDIGQLRRHAH